MYLRLLKPVFVLTASLSSATSSMPSTHPLLVRGPDTHTSTSGRTLSRPVSVRTRAAYRYNPNMQTLVHYVENNGRVSRLGHANATSASGLIDK